MTATAGLQQWGSGTAASMDEQRVVRAGESPTGGSPLHSLLLGHPLQRRRPHPRPGMEHQRVRRGLGPNPQLPEVLSFCSRRLWEGKLRHGGGGLRAGTPRTGRERLLRLRVALPLGAGAPRRGRVQRLRASHAPGATRTQTRPDPTRPLPWDRHSRSRSPSTATRDCGHEAPPLPRPPTSPHPPPPSPRRPLPAPRAPRRPHSAMRPSRMRAPPRIAAGTRRAPAGHGAPPPELERSRGWSRRGGAGGGDGAGGRARAGGCGARCCRRGALIPRGVSPHLTCSDPSSRVQSPSAPRAVPPRPPHPAAPQLLTPPPGCSADPPRPARPCGAARTPGKGRGAAPQKRATHALRTLRGRLWGPGRGAGAAAEPHISSPPPERGLMKVMGRTGAAINS